MARTRSSYSPEEKARTSQMGLANKGRKHTPDELAKMREAGLRRKHTPEEKEKIRLSKLGPKNPNYGKMFSPEYRAKLSASRTGHKNHQYGKPHTPEVRAKISASLTGPLHPNYGKPLPDETVRKIIHSNKLKPNKAELSLQDILDKHFPKQWKFVGDGQFIVGGLCPDFLNINSKKQLIELYGSFWHSEKRLRNWKSTELGRVMHYNSFGFKCLIIWESELKAEAALVEKIRNWV